MSAKYKVQNAKRRNCVVILYDTSSTASGPPSPQGEGNVLHSKELDKFKFVLQKNKVGEVSHLKLLFFTIDFN